MLLTCSELPADSARDMLMSEWSTTPDRSTIVTDLFWAASWFCQWYVDVVIRVLMLLTCSELPADSASDMLMSEWSEYYCYWPVLSCRLIPPVICWYPSDPPLPHYSPDQAYRGQHCSPPSPWPHSSTWRGRGGAAWSLIWWGPAGTLLPTIQLLPPYKHKCQVNSQDTAKESTAALQSRF